MPRKPGRPSGEATGMPSGVWGNDCSLSWHPFPKLRKQPYSQNLCRVSSHRQYPHPLQRCLISNGSFPDALSAREGGFFFCNEVPSDFRVSSGLVPAWTFLVKPVILSYDDSICCLYGLFLLDIFIEFLIFFVFNSKII